MRAQQLTATVLGGHKGRGVWLLAPSQPSCRTPAVPAWLPAARLDEGTGQKPWPDATQHVLLAHSPSSKHNLGHRDICFSSPHLWKAGCWPHSGCFLRSSETQQLLGVELGMLVLSAVHRVHHHHQHAHLIQQLE